MPYLKDWGGFQQSASGVFDQSLAPGASVPVSGIYRCKACGFELVAATGTSLPDTERCADHELRWKTADGKVVWRLVTAAITANG
jgi:hypothetical protein